MADQLVQLTLAIDAGSGADIEEMAELTRQLRQELLELDVEAVELVRAGETPARAKGDPITWGTLILTLAASGGVLTTLINVIQAWLSRQDKRHVILEIDGDKLEVIGPSSEEQQRMIDAWLSRHKGFLIAND